MALKIRLRQQGRNNYQTYRVVLADVRSPRDGKYIEMLGWYNPALAENNIVVDEARIVHWMEQGAKLSETLEQLLSKAAPSIMQNMHAKKLAQKKAKKAKKKAAPAVATAPVKKVAKKKK